MAALAVAVLALGACTGADGSGRPSPPPGGSSSAAEPSPSLFTLTALPQPSEPPTGRWYADMRQSSIDAKLGQMQVWVRDDTVRDLEPRAIRYLDDRLPVVLRGGRLREVPAGSERGFPLVLPRRLDCASPAAQDPAAGEGTGVVEVVTADGVRRVPVADETDVVGRYVAARCQELAVARVASLSWSDRLGRVDGTPALVLVVRPTGVPGERLVVEDVVGSHLLHEAGAPWRPRVTVASDGPVIRIPLPVAPARCDPHGFVEGGGATAFRVHVRVDGRPLEVLLRMGADGARDVIAYAARVCGLD
jgi:hypothetical protein